LSHSKFFKEKISKNFLQKTQNPNIFLLNSKLPFYEEEQEESSASIFPLKCL